MSLITAEKISKEFTRKGKSKKRFEVLKETSFEINKGTVTEIIGRSGGGKSTFVSILSGLLQPDTGKVYYEGKDLYELSDDERSKLRNKKFGIIPQDHMVFKNLSVIENLLLVKEMYGTEDKEEENERLAEELLNKVGLKDYASYKAGELSGGELRRLAIARALINDPEVIFADEPSGDLDEENTKNVLSIFRELTEQGKAVILVTHDREAIQYADYIYRMDLGNLKEEKL
jgi:putative ABC transport system ATP-binding protein